MSCQQRPFYLVHTKHLMTGPEGNSSFCFPRMSMLPRAGEGNVKIRGKQNELFPEGPVIK